MISWIVGIIGSILCTIINIPIFIVGRFMHGFCIGN